MDLRDSIVPQPDDAIALYSSVGWTAYTHDPDRLIRALQRSLRVVTAWEGSDLVGLARIVGDGETIAFLQDVLVHPDHQRQGLGRRLVDAAFEPYVDVRQHVLLTDTEASQRAFYAGLGFSEAHELAPAALRCFVRFSPG